MVLCSRRGLTRGPRRGNGQINCFVDCESGSVITHTHTHTHTHWDTQRTGHKLGVLPRKCCSRCCHHHLSMRVCVCVVGDDVDDVDECITYPPSLSLILSLSLLLWTRFLCLCGCVRFPRNQRHHRIIKRRRRRPLKVGRRPSNDRRRATDRRGGHVHAAIDGSAPPVPPEFRLAKDAKSCAIPWHINPERPHIEITTSTFIVYIFFNDIASQPLLDRCQSYSFVSNDFYWYPTSPSNFMEAVDYVHDSKTFSIWNQKQTTHFAQIEKDVDSFFASRPGVFCSKVIFLANNKGRFFFKKKMYFTANATMTWSSAEKIWAGDNSPAHSPKCYLRCGLSERQRVPCVPFFCFIFGEFAVS